jgi:hypothetical protein
MITKWMYYYLLLSSKNNIWKMTVSLLTANNITSTVYEWLGYFISPYWWHTQLKHFWTKNHTATILNYLTLTRKIQREWTLYEEMPTLSYPHSCHIHFRTWLPYLSAIILNHPIYLRRYKRQTHNFHVSLLFNNEHTFLPTPNYS